MGLTAGGVQKIIYAQNTEPTDKTAGMLWFDTSTNVLKVSNGTSYSGIGGNANLLKDVLGVYATNLAGAVGTPDVALGNIVRATDENLSTTTTGWSWTEGEFKQPRTALTFDLGASATHIGYSIVANYTRGASSTTKVYLETSTDGTTYKTVKTWSATTSINESALFPVTMNTFRYIRVKFGNFEGYGSDESILTITELGVI